MEAAINLAEVPLPANAQQRSRVEKMTEEARSLLKQQVGQRIENGTSPANAWGAVLKTIPRSVAGKKAERAKAASESTGDRVNRVNAERALAEEEIERARSGSKGEGSRLALYEKAKQAKRDAIKAGTARGVGRKLTNDEMADEIRVALAADPATTLKAEQEIFYWLDGISLSPSRLAKVWATVTGAASGSTPERAPAPKKARTSKAEAKARIEQRAAARKAS